MAAITICSDFGAQKYKVWHCFHCFPIYFLWSDGTRFYDLSFLNVELYANFFTLLFHFYQEIFSSSSRSAIRLVSSAYLWLLIFLPAILIPACASSSPAFLEMANSLLLTSMRFSKIAYCAYTENFFANSGLTPCISRRVSQDIPHAEKGPLTAVSFLKLLLICSLSLHSVTEVWWHKEHVAQVEVSAHVWFYHPNHTG